MHDFDAETAVAAAGDGRWTATVSDRWNVGKAPNGGYLAAIGANALAAALPHGDPFSVTTHFLRVPVPGPVEISVEIIRAGRSHSTGQAQLHQEGKEIARTIAVFGELDGLAGPTIVVGERPELPDPETMLSSVGLPGLPEVARRFDIRLDPAAIGGMVGQPTGTAQIDAWIRFVDGREPDAVSLVLVADAMPPPVLNLAKVGWVPTLEMTVHLRGRPVPGWA